MVNAGLQPDGSVVVQCVDKDGNVRREEHIKKDDVPKVNYVRQRAYFVFFFSY